MAFNRVAFAVCLTLGALASQAASLDLIELNDANKNALEFIDLAKAVGGVQDAYQSEFEFDSTYALRKFLAQCELVIDTMANAKDSDFSGLAKQVKAIIAEPSIRQACSVTNEQLTDDFDQLDDLSMADTVYPHLSTNVLALLVSLTKKVNADPVLSQVARHLVHSKVQGVTEQLMSSAPRDIEAMIGETAPANGFFDFKIRYYKFCKISLIAPICKLVRNTSTEVTAIAADVEKFTAALKSGSASSEVAEHTENSGVSIEELKANCSKLQRSFKAIGQIKKYLEAGLLNEETFESFKETDPSLDSYAALYDLCQVAAA